MRMRVRFRARAAVFSLRVRRHADDMFAHAARRDMYIRYDVIFRAADSAEARMAPPNEDIRTDPPIFFFLMDDEHIRL